jgi:hypothetical protein
MFYACISLQNMQKCIAIHFASLLLKENACFGHFTKNISLRRRVIISDMLFRTLKFNPGQQCTNLSSLGRFPGRSLFSTITRLRWQRAVHHSPKHWILLHIYHIQGVIYSKTTRGEQFTDCQTFSYQKVPKSDKAQSTSIADCMKMGLWQQVLEKDGSYPAIQREKHLIKGPYVGHLESSWPTRFSHHDTPTGISLTF